GEPPDSRRRDQIISRKKEARAAQAGVTLKSLHEGGPDKPHKIDGLLRRREEECGIDAINPHRDGGGAKFGSNVPGDGMNLRNRPGAIALTGLTVIRGAPGGPTAS